MKKHYTKLATLLLLTPTIVMANSTGAIVIGENAESQGSTTIVIGKNARNGAQATGIDSFAANYRSVASGDGAVAIGWNAHATGFQSTAVADGSSATSAYSSAFGTRSTAGATYATAVGDSAYASGVSSTAIGKGASTSIAQSVALGSYSLANRAEGSQGYDPLTGTTSTATNSTWQSTRAAVSIGNESLGITRQITGVAAGTEDTDAVNVAQLKRAVESNTKNVEVVAGDNITVTSATAGNATTYTVSAKDTITTVAAADNSVTVNHDGNHNYTIAVSDTIKNKINNNTTNIANNTNRINKLNSKIGKVGAGAAALAALHPLDFDPDDKWNFAAGYGNYSSENAMAVGAFYRPNEDTMFSVAGSVGNGENMINAGVSFKLGQASNVTRSRVAMAQEILDLKADNKDLRQQLADVNDKLNRLLGILDTTKQALFPDVPENHWAYEYIAVLAGNGIIEGYPDGTFKGDLAMTRYEFATMLYRALQNGAKQDATMNKLMNEFEPELRQLHMDRFRIDRISGEDNDRHKINRVRVNSNNDKEKEIYKDIYGNVIQK